MKIKKILGAVISSALLFGMFGLNAGSAATPYYFEDVEAYEANYQAIDYLRENEVVVGYEDGNYKPDDNINRAEFLKIVMEVSAYEPSGEDCFDDVTDQWFAPYICKAADLGFVDGYSDGKFKPEAEINFAEASKIVVNILGVEITEEDYDTWFEEYVMALFVTSAIPEKIDGFDINITRGDMAEMIWRLDTETTYKISNSYENIQDGVEEKEYGSELTAFDSCGELKVYFENNSYSSYYGAELGAGIEDMVMMEETSAAPEMSKSAADSDDSAGDYSSTNVQVQGVDEADILKNDGKYIYYLKDNTVRIIEAYPPSGMKELSEVGFDGDFYANEIYMDDDRLVVIGRDYDDIYTYSGEDSYYSDETLTTILIYDVSDKTDVELLRELSFEGSYSDSRKVDDTVYLIANQYNYYLPWDGDDWVEEDLVPKYVDDGKVGMSTACSEVMYMPGNTGTTDSMIVAAVPVDDADGAFSQQVVMGSAGNMYSSRDNMYIAEPKYKWDWWYEDSGDTEETYIHKFSLDGTNVAYEGVGTVPGTTLNQFSMDEDGDYFRIATTNGWWDDAKNNMYVLDEDLDVVGKVEGLAPGETIYSVRFMGDRAYMVTFEMIDPLFVIDLSSPTNPKVLGELHIPGVSDYLHPFGEDYVIGFGLDTLSESELEDLGWSWFQGMKISMFDVSDVNSPKELHKVTIGDRGTASELLYNHKALLFNESEGYMALPVTLAEIPQNVKDDLELDAWVYGDYTFQGAYVYDVSVEDGFTLRGTISHYEDDELGDDFEYYYYYDYDNFVERVLYIGDYFYTVSDAKVQANEMDSMDYESDVELAE